jgi:hypothetical protein
LQSSPGDGAGIGQAIVRRFAREGARVAIAEIDPLTGKATEDGIRSGGGDAIYVQTDVASEDQIKSLGPNDTGTLQTDRHPCEQRSDYRRTARGTRPRIDEQGLGPNYGC